MTPHVHWFLILSPESLLFSEHNQATQCPLRGPKLSTIWKHCMCWACSHPLQAAAPSAWPHVLPRREQAPSCKALRSMPPSGRPGVSAEASPLADTEFVQPGAAWCGLEGEVGLPGHLSAPPESQPGDPSAGRARIPPQI